MFKKRALEKFEVKREHPETYLQAKMLSWNTEQIIREKYFPQGMSIDNLMSENEQYFKEKLRMEPVHFLNTNQASRAECTWQEVFRDFELFQKKFDLSDDGKLSLRASMSTPNFRIYLENTKYEEFLKRRGGEISKPAEPALKRSRRMMDLSDDFQTASTSSERRKEFTAPRLFPENCPLGTVEKQVYNLMRLLRGSGHMDLMELDSNYEYFFGEKCDFKAFQVPTDELGRDHVLDVRIKENPILKKVLILEGGTVKIKPNAPVDEVDLQTILQLCQYSKKPKKKFMPKLIETRTAQMSPSEGAKAETKPSVLPKK